MHAQASWSPHLMALLVTFVAVACGPAPESETAPAPEPAPAREPPVAEAEPAVVAVVTLSETQEAEPRGVVPYRGPLLPSDPPGRVMDPQRPLVPWVAAALDVLYERPSLEGPPPIPRTPERAIYAVGEGPVIQALPGEMPYIDRVPEILRTALPAKGPFSNHVQVLPAGDIRFVALDRTLNDTQTTRDSMALEVEFTGRDGARWRIVQASLAPLSPNPVMEPWFGGLIVDTLYHGSTENGISAVPTLRCAMCSWGWADVWKDDRRVGSSVPLHVMLTSDTRAGAERGYEYQCYDCTENPIREVHVIIPPSAALPAPGGFLHVMWEDAEVTRGTPAQIARAAPKIGEEYPTITLRAVPYLEWSDTVIHVQAKQRYRLLLENVDPSANHAFHLHMAPGHHGHMHTRGRGEASRMEAGREEDELPSAEHGIRVPLPPGPKWATTVEFSEPGEYHFGCPVENHETRGMRGKFIVSAPAGAGQGGEQ